MTMAGDEDPDQVVRSIEQAWAGHAASGDPERIASLYRDDAVFFGSSPRLFHGRDDIATYFAALPPGFLLGVSFSEGRATAIGDDVIVYGALAPFRVAPAGEPIDAPYRITLTLARSERQWLIAQHHASPRAD